MENPRTVCDILIDDCTVLDENYAAREHTSVAVKDGIILEIGDPGTFRQKYSAGEILKGEGKLLMPGMVDGHTHVCQQFLRGRARGTEPMTWSGVLVPFESSLTPQNVRASARLACLEMIRAGITAFADAGGVHMDQVADIVLESGMRAALCRSSMDIGGAVQDRLQETPDEIISRFEDLYRAYDGKGNGRVRIWLGLREIMTCSTELMRRTAETAREYKTGIHAHLCEHRDEVSFSLTNYGLRPAELLKETDVLGPNLLTAHNVLLTDKDILLLAESGTHVIHCPKANLASHGFPRVTTILANGISVGLGCDGASASALEMFELARILQLAVIANIGLPVFDKAAITYVDMLEMITHGGAAAIMEGDTLGMIAPGRKADMVMLDISGPYIDPTQHLEVSLAYNASGRDVTDTIIDGQIVMKDRQVLTLDEEKIVFESKAQMKESNERAVY